MQLKEPTMKEVPPAEGTSSQAAAAECKEPPEPYETASHEDPVKPIGAKGAMQEVKSEEQETDDELIELCWQNLLKDASRHKINDSTDEELVEDDAVYDQDPQLPGSSSRTQAIKARLKHDVSGKHGGASYEVEQCEAKRQRTARNQRIQSANETGKHSDKFDGRIRGATNEQATKFQRGNAGRIRRDEMHAIRRILQPCTASPSSSPPRNLNFVSCSSKAGHGGIFEKTALTSGIDIPFVKTDEGGRR